MSSDPIRTNYRPRIREDKPAVGLAPDLAAFLQALARAVRQYRTYPASSPLCIDAVALCDQAFTALGVGSPLFVRVTPHELVVGDVRVGRGTVLEQELARPLHRARVASLEFERSASARDWSRFCGDLFRLQRLGDTKTTLGELLAEGGVASIRVRATPRPEVVELGAPAPSVCALVERERDRLATAASGGPAQYFYPPEKGWIRLDPTVALDTVSLIDLAVLLDDPGELAAVLMRLTDDDADVGADAAPAIEQKYGDVVKLLSALDPRLARVMLAKLARAVLDLDADRRRALLRRTILPGLLDGRSDAAPILGEFPDVDLADALCLLLDLETAAPEVLSTALDRLAVSADRRQAIVPMIERKLAAGAASTRPDALESYAGALVRVAPQEGKRFDEFAAFDLSMTPSTTEALNTLLEAIHATNATSARLACLARLVRLEPNPAAVAVFLDSAVSLLRQLAHEARWADAARAIESLASAGAAMRDARPEAWQATCDAFERLADRRFVLDLAALCSDGSDRETVTAIVGALGRAIVPAWVAALDRPSDCPRVRPLATIVAEHATLLAPALAAALPAAGLAAARVIVSALGCTHGRYEALIGSQLARGDESVGREALRALARIGSREAAAIVAGQLERGPAWARAVAEEALWRFPYATAMSAARDLLGRRAFVVQEPQIAERLLDRAAHGAAVDFDPVLAQLTQLRFRFWSPALVRIAGKARDLQQ